MESLEPLANAKQQKVQADIRLSEQERLYPHFIPWMGLVACLFLAFWVDRTIWLAGVGLIAAGLIWQQLANHLFPADAEQE